jgi:hypothetical protein
MRGRGIAILGAALLFIGAVAATAAEPNGRGPDPAVKAWPDWPGRVACGPTAPSFHPQSALSRPADAEKGSLPAEVALREWLREKRQPGPERHDWRLLGANEEIAEFIRGGIGDESAEQVAFLRSGDSWKAAFKLHGPCRFRARRGSRVATSWILARGSRLMPSTRIVKIRLEARECSSGRMASARLERPAFRRENGALLMTLWLRPLPPGNYTCQKALEPPVIIKLPRQLGNSELLDGSVFPPRPPGQAASRSAFLRQ